MPRNSAAYHAAYYKANSERILASKAAYNKAHPETKRAWDLKNKYGITLERYDAMLIAQCGRCAICNNPMDGKKEPCVDLCSPCNFILGHAKDDPEVLELAVVYLRCDRSSRC